MARSTCRTVIQFCFNTHKSLAVSTYYTMCFTMACIDSHVFVSPLYCHIVCSCLYNKTRWSCRCKGRRWSVASTDFLRKMTNLGMYGFAGQIRPYHMLGLKVIPCDDIQLLFSYYLMYLCRLWRTFVNLLHTREYPKYAKLLQPYQQHF